MRLDIMNIAIIIIHILNKPIMFFQRGIQSKLKYLTTKSWWTWTILANNNSSKGNHKQDARSNQCTLFFNNIYPLNYSRKRLVHFGFEMPCWVQDQSIMFDPPTHKNIIHDKHNTLISNPSNNNGTRVKFH
jgi:hypothetical protein